MKQPKNFTVESIQICDFATIYSVPKNAQDFLNTRGILWGGFEYFRIHQKLIKGFLELKNSPP